MTNVLFAVRLEAALRVRPFISTDEIRYYMNGVHVRPSPAGGAICEATDGHRLGARHDPDGLVNKQAIVRIPKEIKAASGLIRKWLVAVETRSGKGYVCIVTVKGLDDKGEPRDDTAENAIAMIDDCEMRFGNCVIDGNFPGCNHVIPVVKDTAVKRSFNASYFSSFGKHLTIAGDDESSPQIILDSADPYFVGVLMPMRLGTKDFAIPAWLIAKPKMKRAA